MLYNFLISNRPALIAVCHAKMLRRRTSHLNDGEFEHGIPLFLDQVIETLRIEQTSEPWLSVNVSGEADGGRNSSEVGATAARHGLELLQKGFTIDQVVHDYGDLCQAITEMASQCKETVLAAEFQTLNRCLDNAIADAVTEYSYERDVLLEEKGDRTLNERLGFLAHELRNFIHVGAMAFGAIKLGRVGLAGATSAVVDRSFIGLRNLIDRTLADVRLNSGLPTTIARVGVAELIAEIKASASLEAEARGCKFTVAAVDPRLAVDADRDLLLAGIGNLLQNAFKYTKVHTEVTLCVHDMADRIHIDIEDHCGGIPQGFVDTMFLPFTQGSADKSGLGLGLAICRRVVEANNGVLSVCNSFGGTGCIFTIDMPKQTLAG